MNFTPIKTFVKNHADLFTFLGLCILFYLIFFHNIGNYALMDVDETRYVSMAREMFQTKDFLTLHLNGEYFFEKPPLYFWGECLSFALFGKINEFTARFPVAFYGMMSCFLLYFTGKKIVSREFGVISSLILATSMEFTILAKFAILDIVVSTCVAFAVMFGFITYFCRESRRKYYWWLFYIFSGLAVMAKGIPGFVLPFGTMFFIGLATKKLKAYFKPQYFVVGMILFLLVVLPWHMIMFKIHDPLFFNEYIVKHHINRFFSSSEIHRAEPFYFYIVTLLWGLIPWIFSAIALAIARFKSIKKFSYDELTLPQKYMLFNWIGFLVTFIFFSISKTKLITYILPVFFFTANILGYAWNEYINKNANKKAINLSVYIFGGLMIFTGITAMFTKYYLPEQLYLDILNAKWLCITLVLFLGISSVICAVKDKKRGVFYTYVIFMTLLSALGTKELFNIDYKFGQNDIMEYAKIAKDNGNDVVIFGHGRRYSLLYYYGGPVTFEVANNYPYLDKALKNKNTLFIIKKKEYHEIAKNEDDFEILKTGRKYLLIRGKKDGQKGALGLE